jgi:hypothetical protein
MPENLITTLNLCSLIIIIIIRISFIISQQHLAKNITLINQKKFHFSWYLCLWTQIIPFFSWITFIVTVLKLKNEIYIYELKYNKSLNFNKISIFIFILLSILLFIIYMHICLFLLASITFDTTNYFKSIIFIIITSITINIFKFSVFIVIWVNISQINNKILNSHLN